MAIVINPDGTVSTIETTHDQYGNLRPKIDSEVMKEQEIHYNKNTISETRGKKGYVYPTSTISGKNDSSPISFKRPIFTTTGQIDKFFSKKISSGKWLGNNEYLRIKVTLSENLQVYFASKYQEYIELMKRQGGVVPKQIAPKTTKQLRKQQHNQKLIDELEAAMRRTTFKKPKDKKKKNKNKTPHQVKEVKVRHTSHAGFTIGEIATFGSLKENLASSQDYDVRTSNPPRPARPPQYAYARDRFGRVQERDSFNEEKKNEFYVAQNRQSNYDYSSYDANDDNDGAYSGWD